MKISNKGLAIIKKYEGCRLTAYKDAVGILTIGYGHTKNVKAGQQITQDQADAYLLEDVVKAENAVNKYINKYRFNQNQFDALVSFAFNIGSIDQLTQKGTRTLTKISQCIPAYCNAGGKQLLGLVRRRNEEKALFDTPCDAAVEVPELKPVKTSYNYEVGKIYTLQCDVNVRVEPSASAAKFPYGSLTANAKKHAVNKTSALEKGTRITCKDVFVENVNKLWIKSPSGWMCAVNGKDVYIK